MALERAPADRTGTIGVEAFDATYGAGFQASDDPPHAVECKLVEDGAVNLTPIAGLERHLHRLQGDARLALRAVREEDERQRRDAGHRPRPELHDQRRAPANAATAVAAACCPRPPRRRT